MNLEQLAIRIRDTQREHQCTREGAITRVSHELLSDDDILRDTWRDIGWWVLSAIDVRAPHLLGAPVKSVARPGESWAAKKTDSWTVIEARIGAGRERKPWGKINEPDLTHMTDVWAKSGSTLTKNATLGRQIIPYLKDGKTLADAFHKLPITLQAWVLERTAAGSPLVLTG